MSKISRTLVIDFETANFAPTSACELGMVVIEDNEIIHTERCLIKTPTPLFTFTYIHGIAWKHVEKEPHFGEWWESHLDQWFNPSSKTHSELKIVAHNIGFDKRVLEATAAHHKIKLPKFTQDCTVQLSRKKLGISPAKLNNVCDQLEIPLDHHSALSDAKASAYIYLYAETGKKFWKKELPTAKKSLNSPKSEKELARLLSLRSK